MFDISDKQRAGIELIRAAYKRGNVDAETARKLEIEVRFINTPRYACGAKLPSDQWLDAIYRAINGTEKESTTGELRIRFTGGNLQTQVKGLTREARSSFRHDMKIDYPEVLAYNGSVKFNLNKGCVSGSPKLI